MHLREEEESTRHSYWSQARPLERGVWRGLQGIADAYSWTCQCHQLQGQGPLTTQFWGSGNTSPSLPTPCLDLGSVLCPPPSPGNHRHVSVVRASGKGLLISKQPPLGVAMFQLL